VIDPALGSLIAAAIAVLFATAAVHKFRDLKHFTAVVAAYRIVPGVLARRLAWTIPCAELTVALALLWPVTRPWAAWTALGLLVLYAASMGLNLARNRRDLDCGCLAAGHRRPIAPWMVWRNVLLALCALVTALPWTSRALTGADLLTIIGGATASFVLYLALDRLLGEVAPRTALWTGGGS
jgi:uncharacterized membrane protein